MHVALHHFPLCPFSRLARIILAEKQIGFKLIEEKPWERADSLGMLNPSFELPILVIDDKSPISSIYAIAEFLEAEYQPQLFLSNDNYFNAEVRRLFAWFNQKFYAEVTKYIFDEKVITHYVTENSPRSNYIRAAKANLNHHLDYMEYLLKSRRWLAGNSASFADIAAAAQLSVLDYLGDVNWEKHELVKEWYSVLKSRPSFRPILTDRIRGFTPPPHYQNLDF